MSGTYKPIAGLSPDNQGPANTVVAIILSTTSILISSFRYAIGRKRLLQIDNDDVMFGVALCFGVTASIVSQASVTAGLGRHQDTLSQKQIERYFKLHWASQFLTIIALACAKLSVVLMFRRIIPVALAPYTLRILVPITTLYAVICILLVAFQCQPPYPWILNPKTCSSRGNVYYATTALNMLTDVLLAGWILPTIWALQMKQNTKILVMSMFASRVVVCAVDVGRFVVIQRALEAANDQTWFQLPWAILDQVVVHLSINHATLPRVHVFLSNLQTGLLVTRLTTDAVNTNLKGSKRSNDADDSLPLSGTYERKRRPSWNWRQKLDSSFPIGKVMKTLRSDEDDATKEGSISESPLRLQFMQDFELSTTVYTDDDSSPNQGETSEKKTDWWQHAMSNVRPITSLPIEHLSRSISGRQVKDSGSNINGQHMTINVHKTVERKTEFVERTYEDTTRVQNG